MQSSSCFRFYFLLSYYSLNMDKLSSISPSNPRGSPFALNKKLSELFINCVSCSQLDKDEKRFQSAKANTLNAPDYVWLETSNNVCINDTDRCYSRAQPLFSHEPLLQAILETGFSFHPHMVTVFTPPAVKMFWLPAACLNSDVFGFHACKYSLHCLFQPPCSDKLGSFSCSKGNNQTSTTFFVVSLLQ